MADLFERDKSVISRHLRNIFQSGELVREAAVAKNASTASDGRTYQMDFYNLDAIIANRLVSLSAFSAKQWFCAIHSRQQGPGGPDPADCGKCAGAERGAHPPGHQFAE